MVVHGQSQKNRTPFLTLKELPFSEGHISKLIIEEQFGLCFWPRHGLSDLQAGPGQHGANFPEDFGKAL